MQMKIYIMVDFEGVAGMIEWDNYVEDTPATLDKRLRLRQILTGEVNAAIEGVLAAGATEVVVWDSHGPSNNCNNFILEELHPEAWVIIGWKGLPNFYPCLDDSFNAGLYIGGHAMEGTPNAVLPHTKTIVNGTPYGEVGMFAVMCGWHGVPMVFISGDQATVKEVQQVVPDVEDVVTKIAFGPYAAKTRTPKKARELIRLGVEKAIGRVDEIKPVHLKPPFILGEGEKQIQSDNLQELHKQWLNRWSNAMGNMDIQPERQRVQEKRAAWKKERSFLV